MTTQQNSPNTPHSSDFYIPIRVYYEDTDAGGVVYHSNYINFFERARTEWLRHHGYEQDALVTEHQLVFVVRALDCEYLRPAQFNDELFVSAAIREMGRTSVVFKQQVLRRARTAAEQKQGDYTVLATGSVTVVAVNAETLRPIRLPQFLLEITP